MSQRSRGYSSGPTPRARASASPRRTQSRSGLTPPHKRFTTRFTIKFKELGEMCGYPFTPLENSSSGYLIVRADYVGAARQIERHEPPRYFADEGPMYDLRRAIEEQCKDIARCVDVVVKKSISLEAGDLMLLREAVGRAVEDRADTPEARRSRDDHLGFVKILEQVMEILGRVRVRLDTAKLAVQNNAITDMPVRLALPCPRPEDHSREDARRDGGEVNSVPKTKKPASPGSQDSPRPPTRSGSRSPIKWLTDKVKEVFSSSHISEDLSPSVVDSGTSGLIDGVLAGDNEIDSAAESPAAHVQHATSGPVRESRRAQRQRKANAKRSARGGLKSLGCF